MLYYTSTSDFPIPSSGENQHSTRENSSTGRQLLRNSGNTLTQKVTQKWPALLLFFVMLMGSQFASAQCITAYDPVSKVKTDCVGEFTYLKVNFTPQMTNPTITWQYSSNAGGTWQAVSSSPIAHTINNDFAEASTRLNLSATTAMMDNYLFRVVFSGSCVQTSDAFLLDLNGPVSITQHPASATICETTLSQIFEAQAIDPGAQGGSVEYRWQYFGNSTWNFIPNTVVGWNTTTLQLTNAASFWPAAGSSVQIRCRVRIATCAVQYTNPATLQIDKKPTVDAGPVSATICEDGILNLNATVNNAVYAVTWTGGGGGILDPNALSTIFDPPNAGPFNLTVTTNANGTCSAGMDQIAVTINTLSLDNYTPGNASAAGTRTICDGEDTDFRVDYSNSVPVSLVNWEYSLNGSPWTPIAALLSGATVIVNNTLGQARLDLDNVSNTLDGALFRVTIIAGTCTKTSDVFDLAVNGPVSITMHPQNVTNLCASTPDTTFSVVATAESGTIGYLWQYNTGGGWINVPNTVAGYNTDILNPTSSDFPVWPNPGSSVDLRVRISTGGCPNIFSNPATFTVSMDLPAVANAGPDANICEGDNYFLGSAAISGPGISTASWDNNGGDGFFNDPNILKPTYTPGPNDIAAGSVTLTITTNDPVGVCEATSDDIVITIHPATVVDAGMDQAACAADTPEFQLAGSVSGTVTTGTWNDGGAMGTFLPNANTLNAIYVPAVSAYGTTVTLTLTSATPPVFTTCAFATDMVNLTIDKLEISSYAPVSQTQIVCSGSNTTFRVNYTSAPVNPATVVWQVDGGAGFTDITFPNALYSLSTPGGNTQLNLTNVPLGVDGFSYRAVLTSGTCTVTSDPFTIQVNESATANAGADQFICGGENVPLSGSIGGVAISATWSTSGSGTFVPNSSTLNATYIPNASDYGTVVTLTLTTNNPAGPCGPGVDMMDVSIDAVTVDSETPASLIRDICEGTNTSFTVQYKAVSPLMAVGPVETWQYSSNGGATWSNASGLGTITSPALTGMATNSSRLTLTAVPLSYDDYLFRLKVSFGECDKVISMFSLQVNPGPTVDAGNDFSICAGETIVLNGSVGGTATTGTWTHTGGGVLSGVNLFNADATYTPVSGDFGTAVMFTLTTDNPGGACPAVSETIAVTIDELIITSTIPAAPVTTITCDGDVNHLYEVRYKTRPGVQTPTWEYSIDGGMIWQNATSPDFDVIDLPATYPSNSKTQLNIPLVSSDMDGYMFRAVFSEGACAPVKSEIFTLQVNGPITITAQPVDVLNECQSSESVMFGATVENPGSGTLQYQWRRYTGITPPTVATSGTVIPTSNVNYDGADTNVLTVFNTGGVFPTAGGSSYYYKLGVRLDPCLPTYTYSDWVEFSVSGDPAPMVSLGTPGDICSNGVADLSGLVTLTAPATSGTWSTMGDGTFSDPDDVLTAMYTPGPGDIEAAALAGAMGHMVKLVFTTNDPVANVCPSAVDSTFLTIYAETKVDAGEDQSLCSDALPTIQLNGTISGTVTTGTWSGGSDDPGGYSNNTDLNSTYTPLMGEYGSTIVFTLTSDAPSAAALAAGCIATSDNVSITIDDLSLGGNSPLAPAAFCESSGSTFFRVNYVSNPDPNPAVVEWQVDLGAGFENVTTAMFLVDGVPTAIDQTITTTGTQTRLDINSAPFELNGMPFKAIITSGACSIEGPVFTLSVNEEVTIDPGTYDPICSGDVIALDGMISGGRTTGKWGGGPAGNFSPDNLTLDAVYTPTAAQITAGKAVLNLNATPAAGAGECPFVAVPVTIFIDQLSVDASTPATFVRNVCEGQNTFFSVDYTSFDGTTAMPAEADVLWEYSTDSGANWLDADIANGGIGTVSSPAAANFATRLSLADVPLTYNNYLVRVTLDNGACTGEQVMFALYVNPGPTVDAGPDITVCSGEDVMLNGSIGGSATTGTWTRIPNMLTPGVISGANLFAADATYTPHPDEYGSVVLLKLTTNNPGGACPAVMDTIAVTIDQLVLTSYEPVSLARTECVGDAEFFQVNYASAPGTQTPAWEYSSNGIDWLPAVGPDYSVDNMTPGETRLDIPSVTNAMNGLLYRAVFTEGNCAPINSDAFILTVNGAISITQQPVDILDICGSTESVQFMADAMNDGEGVMSFLWQYSPDGISGWLPLTEVMGQTEGIATGTLTLYNTSSFWPTLGNNIYFRMRVSLNSCSAVTTDVVEFSVNADVPAGVDAGSDDEICEGSTYTLGAVLSGSATSGMWTTSGDGTFDNASFTGATYTPGANDLGMAQAAGPMGHVVTLTFTTNDPVLNICPAATDMMELTIYPAIQVDAGQDINVCIDGTQLDPILLNGSVTGAVTGGLWAPGNGLLNPGDVVTIYTPTNSHVSSGSRRLILTSDPHSVCPIVKDTMFVYFNANFGTLSYNPGTTTAGTRTVCNGDDTDFRVEHGLTPTTLVQWQYNAGSGWIDVNDATTPLSGVASFDVTFPTPGGNNATQLNLNAVTTAVHDYDFRVILTNGECQTTSDAFNLQVNGDIGTITMPADLIVCESVTTQTFMATVGASGNGTLDYQWQYSNTSAMGPFVSVPAVGATGVTSTTLMLTAASAAYPTVGNTVYLRLRVTLAGCTTVFSDSFEFSVESAANVYAGVDQFICEGDIALMASAFYGGAASSVTWTTAGDGSFDDPAEILAIYTPGPTDISNGSVVLTVTTNEPQGDECPAVSDNMTLFIDPAATVDAGEDQVVCKTDLVDMFEVPLPTGYIQLAGTIGGAATTSTWTTSGDGTFDFANLLNARYYPGPNDRSNQTVTLTLTTNDPGTECGAVADMMVIAIGPGVNITSYVPVSRERTICSGGTATFRVNTSPTVLGTHDWQYSFNGVDWLDDFNSIGFTSYIESGFDTYTELTLGGGAPNIPTGTMYCRVTIVDRDCEQTSQTFTLNVNGPLDWDVQPADLIICNTTSLASFTAIAFNGGAGAVTYQWQYFNGASYVNVPASVAGYNGTTLFLTNAASFWPVPGNTVELRLAATLDQCGTIYSEVVTLEIQICVATELTTVFSIDGTTFTNGQSRDGVFLVQNIGANATTQPISFLITLPSSSVMTSVLDPMATMANVFGGISVNNSDWNITALPIGFLLESKPGVVINPGSFSLIGINFTAIGVPNSTSNTKGILATGTAGDVNPNNNTTRTTFVIN
ncbi:MAG: hypothetical protein KDC85_02180 [Saprospiraceae bacterium]|nr:hypothetical protein [Saprospiraceae bacterium]MCB9323767.1 hypothetical protein [Lewinellaceae bacterium]